MNEAKAINHIVKDKRLKIDIVKGFILTKGQMLVTDKNDKLKLSAQVSIEK